MSLWALSEISNWEKRHHRNLDFSRENKVRLWRKQSLFQTKYRFLPDIRIFPLYCPLCQKSLPEFYLHGGSRYGFVSSFACPIASPYHPHDLGVTDLDESIVDRIFIAGQAIEFEKLYMLDISYLEQLRKKYGFSDFLKKEVIAGNVGREFLLEDFARQLAQLCQIELTGELTFQTDSRFSQLPPDANLWIELLYRAKINLPESLKLVKS